MAHRVAEPDRLHRHRGSRALQRMVEFAPATGGLALWCGHQDRPDEAAGARAAAPPLTTDGRTLFYGARFAPLPLPEQIGLVAHAVLHIALRHPQRFAELEQVRGDVDLRLWNICADAIVDSALGHLGWLRLPSGSIPLERLLASVLGLDRTAEAALLEWDVERLYRAIDDRRPSDADGRRRDGNDAARADARDDGPRSARVRALGREAHADLQSGPRLEEVPDAEAEEARGWTERLLRAHAADGAHSMLRTLVADLPRPRTPWEAMLRTQLARGLSLRPSLSWSRPSRSYLANQGRAGPNRRMPWEPGLGATKRVPRLALIVDVSGSIDADLLARFAREITSITRRLEAGLVLVVGDDRVRRVEHFEPGRSTLHGLAFEGGGATDFAPLLEEADRHRPDIGVVLTDLDGPAGRRPRWPVIWAVPPGPVPLVAPFGRVLRLD